MYFFIESRIKLTSRAEQFDISYEDVYVKALQQMQEEYSLPALHEWGDGYCKGDASISQLVDLVKTINDIEGGDSPAVYLEEDIEDESNILTDIFVYLDKKLIEKIEAQIESQIVSFGEDNEYSSTQFEAYKESAEKLIRGFLTEEYYTSGGSQIGHDYSVFFLADDITCFEHVEASSNWMFQEANDARFRIVHLNNFDKAFSDFSDFVSENDFGQIYAHLDVENNDVQMYLERIHGAFDNVELDDDIDNDYDTIESLYSDIEFAQKVKMWKTLDSNTVDVFNSTSRSEVIDSIIEAINWDEIESYFDAQFCQES